MTSVLHLQGKVVDFPYDEIRRAVAEHVRHGCTVFPKFTCEHCKQRVTARAPNVVVPFFACPSCGKQHDFRKSGGNYVLFQERVSIEEVEAMLKRSETTAKPL